MDEMRQKMRTSLEDYYAERAEMELRERLLHQAAATMDHPLSLPRSARPSKSSWIPCLLNWRRTI